MKLNELVGNSIVEQILRRFICSSIPFAGCILINLDVDSSFLLEYVQVLKDSGFKLEVTPLSFPLSDTNIKKYEVIVTCNERVFGLNK